MLSFTAPATLLSAQKAADKNPLKQRHFPCESGATAAGSPAITIPRQSDLKQIIFPWRP